MKRARVLNYILVGIPLVALLCTVESFGQHECLLKTKKKEWVFGTPKKRGRTILLSTEHGTRKMKITDFSSDDNRFLMHEYPVHCTDIPPVRTISMFVQEIYENRFVLEGKIVRIPFFPTKGKQISPDTYQFQFGRDSDVPALIYVPKAGYVEWRKLKKKDFKDGIYAKVTTGKLANTFGASLGKGLIMQAVGRTITDGQYSW